MYRNVIGFKGMFCMIYNILWTLAYLVFGLIGCTWHLIMPINNRGESYLKGFADLYEFVTDEIKDVWRNK